MSNAHSVPGVIEKFGARKPHTGAPESSSRMDFETRMSSRNSSGRERVDAAMQVAVRRDLVSRVGDPAHQKRMTLGDPSEREERGVRVMAREQLEQDADGMLEAARMRVPILLAARHDRTRRPGNILPRRR